MATPRKSDEKYPGYFEDQDRKPFKPTAREEELLSKTVHPDDFEQFIRLVAKNEEEIRNRLETLEVRFNELCQMMFVQLANSSFLTLKIMEAVDLQ